MEHMEKLLIDGFYSGSAKSENTTSPDNTDR
jgi:hypothetical protein